MKIQQTLRHVILSAGAIASLGGATLVAQEPVGTWNLKMYFGDREMASTLVISHTKSGALQGKWSSERGESEVSKVQFAKGKLTFVRKVSFNEQEMEMSFEGKIEGDKLTGQIFSDFGELDIEGSRKATAKPKVTDAKADKPKISPLVGTWEVTMSSQRGERKSKMIINADLSAAIEDERGKNPIKNVKLDGKNVTYQMVIARQDREFVLDFAGTLAGTKLTGKYSIAERGDIADVTAVKIGPKPEKAEKTDAKNVEAEKAATKKTEAKPEAALVGTWDIASQSDFGERKAQLIVKEDLSAGYETERGAMKVTNLKVKDGKLTFTLTVDLQEREFVLEFVGKLDGDKITGVYQIEGQGDVADVTGKKRK